MSEPNRAPLPWHQRLLGLVPFAILAYQAYTWYAHKTFAMSVFVIALATLGLFAWVSREHAVTSVPSTPTAELPRPQRLRRYASTATAVTVALVGLSTAWWLAHPSRLMGLDHPTGALVTAVVSAAVMWPLCFAIDYLAGEGKARALSARSGDSR